MIENATKLVGKVLRWLYIEAGLSPPMDEKGPHLLDQLL